jgi:hypothetical protein
MDRISGENVTDKNQFQDEDKEHGIDGTTLSSTWLNSIQEELCNTIQSENITLDVKDNNQLKKAIESKILTSSNKLNQNIDNVNKNILASIGSVNTKLSTNEKNISDAKIAIEQHSKDILTQKSLLISNNSKSLIKTDDTNINIESDNINLKSANITSKIISCSDAPSKDDQLANKLYVDRSRDPFMYADTIKKREYNGFNVLLNKVIFDNSSFSRGMGLSSWNSDKTIYTIQNPGFYLIEANIAIQILDLAEGTYFDLFLVVNNEDQYRLSTWHIILPFGVRIADQSLYGKIVKYLRPGNTISITIRLQNGVASTVSPGLISSISITNLGLSN